MVKDITVILIVAYILTYTFLYKKEKWMGDIMFILLGLLTYFVTDSYIGATLILISIIVTIWDNTDKVHTMFNTINKKGDEW